MPDTTRCVSRATRRWLPPLLLLVGVSLAVSGWQPYERSTWWMEVWFR